MAVKSKIINAIYRGLQLPAAAFVCFQLLVGYIHIILLDYDSSLRRPILSTPAGVGAM